DRTGFYQPVVSPDAFEQTIPRDDAVLVLHEVLEKLEFAPCQPDGRAIDGDRHGVEIGDEVLVAIAACGGRVGDRGRTPQYGADAGGQLTEAEWFRDVVVGPELEARDAIVLARSCRQHDDGHMSQIRSRLDDPADLQAVHH